MATILGLIYVLSLLVPWLLLETRGRRLPESHLPSTQNKQANSQGLAATAVTQPSSEPIS